MSNARPALIASLSAEESLTHQKVRFCSVFFLFVVSQYRFQTGPAHYMLIFSWNPHRNLLSWSSSLNTILGILQYILDCDTYRVFRLLHFSSFETGAAGLDLLGVFLTHVRYIYFSNALMLRFQTLKEALPPNDYTSFLGGCKYKPNIQMKRCN